MPIRAHPCPSAVKLPDSDPVIEKFPIDLIKTDSNDGLEEGVQKVEAGKDVEVPVPPLAKQIMKGFHIEPWMFAAGPWAKMDKAERPPLSEYKPFTNFVAKVKDVHGTVLNMWPPKTFEKRGTGTYESDMLWPSEYDRHSIEENLLKEIATAFQEEGIRLFTMLRCPYPRKLEEFPVTKTSDREAPFLSRHTREYLTGITREQAASGVDGVGVGYDEQQSRGIRSLKAADDFTRQTFEKRYGVPFPEKAADNEAFRKWIVFAYEEFASYLADAAAAAKRENRKVFTKTPTHVSLGTMWNVRIDVGIAEDIVCHTADLDFIRANCYFNYDNMFHYVSAANVKRAVGANRRKRVASLHNCPWTPNMERNPGFYRDFPPVFMRGMAVSSVMHGSRLPLFWRHNFIYYGGYDKYVRQAYQIIDTISAWGAKDATVPRNIAVLKSRASEDWWQVRQRYGEGGDPMDQTRAFTYEKWLMEFLITRGYMFDVFFLEYPEDYAKALSHYDLVILPFPYSMSRDAFRVVEKAMKRGTKVMVFDRRGEMDEWGAAYEEPLLSNLIDNDRVVFVADDVPSVGHDPRFTTRMAAAIDDALGEKKATYLNAYGNDVELGCLEKGDREKFLFLINWTARSIEVDAGLQMPVRGEYEVLQRDLESTRRIRIGGAEYATADQLNKFRVALAPGEIKVFYVRPR